MPIALSGILPQYWAYLSLKVNTLSHDNELAENRCADTLEKQTFFVSQYTELVTEYGGWCYSFYRP